MRDTGDVTFEGSDAASIKVETSSGDVTGTLLSDKIFRYKANTGRVELPQTTTGGVCDITTDTGDIIIRIASD
jgi:cytoskeletal protein RodZ